MQPAMSDEMEDDASGLTEVLADLVDHERERAALLRTILDAHMETTARLRALQMDEGDWPPNPEGLKNKFRLQVQEEFLDLVDENGPESAETLLQELYGLVGWNGAALNVLLEATGELLARLRGEDPQSAIDRMQQRTLEADEVPPPWGGKKD